MLKCSQTRLPSREGSFHTVPTTVSWACLSPLVVDASIWDQGSRPKGRRVDSRLVEDLVVTGVTLCITSIHLLVARAEF